MIEKSSVKPANRISVAGLHHVPGKGKVPGMIAARSACFKKVMKRLSILTIIMLFLVACAGPVRMSTPSPTLTPAPTPECHQSGTTKADKVFFPESGETHAFMVYLPPCYSEYGDQTYPVLYWTAAGGPEIFATSDRLIRQGDIPAFIIIMVNISPEKGYGADAQIVDRVVPYIDSHYRTRADRPYRSITGISHGAAIAVRAAFRPPNVFGRVAVLSGGIADGEQEKFTGWISSMPPGQRPAVLVDVADQDGIIVLTHYLTDLLDKLSYPYTFTHAPGNHNSEYWGSHMVDFLKWLIPAH